MKTGAHMGLLMKNQLKNLLKGWPKQEIIIQLLFGILNFANYKSHRQPTMNIMGGPYRFHTLKGLSGEI
jgi:hypothetical protein